MDFNEEELTELYMMLTTEKTFLQVGTEPYEFNARITHKVRQQLGKIRGEE